MCGLSAEEWAKCEVDCRPLAHGLSVCERGGDPHLDGGHDPVLEQRHRVAHVRTHKPDVTPALHAAQSPHGRSRSGGDHWALKVEVGLDSAYIWAQYRGGRG